jgi:hypothetical protein
MSYEQSESIKEIAGALVAFHKAVGKIKKSSDNPFFKSKYADLSDILDAVEGPLDDAGLSVVQFPTLGGLVTQVSHVSGEWMRGEYAVSPKEANNPQALGSAITYARRYALSAALSLNVDNDDDGNAASAPQRPTVTHPLPKDDSPASSGEPPRSGEFRDMTLDIQDIEERKSKAGATYWQAVSADGFSFAFFKNYAALFQEGHSYACKFEVGEYNGREQLKLVSASEV